MSAPVPDPGFRVGPDTDTDRYQLGPAVGGGAEGILYRGTITTTSGLSLQVGIKMLQPRYLPQLEQWHTRWSEQVELLRSLQVPGLVTVRDGFLGPLPHLAGQSGSERTLYLVMNWVDGQSLDEWVRQRTERDPVEDLKVLIPVAAALDLMHSGRSTSGVPVVHRDVKPSNILVTGAGTVLVDFGLTRGLPGGQRLSGVVGTAGYLAPEAVDSGTYSPATDRYALGAVTYFVLTGTEPPRTHQPEVARAAMAAAPALAERPELVESVMAMMDPDPAARPEALANWVAQLRGSSLPSLPDDLQPQAPGRHPQAPGRPGPRRRAHFSGRTIAAGTAGALLMVSAAAALLWPGHRPEPKPIVLSSSRTTTTTSTTPSTNTVSGGLGAGTTVASAAAITGTVTDAAGQPVPGAYVMGLDSLTVVRTDPTGAFSMSCTLSTHGVSGSRSEPLVAATWLLPVVSPGEGSAGLGSDTTSYGPPPDVPGLGYSFSGGAADAADASIASCDGRPVDFVLQPGGGADIHLLDPSGTPVTSSSVPPDNLYLPGLDGFAALETAPLTDSGDQIVDQLAGGILRIDATGGNLNCSGTEVTPDPAADGVDVAITAGQVTPVTCQET